MDSELISESVKLLSEGVEPDSTEVFVEYDLLGGWKIELRGDATDPIDGFGSLKMVYSEINEWHATEEGVTGRLLRLIPFRDAQQRFDRLRNQLTVHVDRLHDTRAYIQGARLVGLIS